MVEWGSFFFQPLQLHLQAADLLVQLCLQDFLLASPLPTMVREQFGQSQQLTLPLTDLRRMDPIVRRQLVHRPALLHRCQRHYGFALGTMLPALHRHRTSLLPVEPFRLPELTYALVQFLGSPAAFVRGQMGRARGILTDAIDLITLSSEWRLHVTHVCSVLTGVRDHRGEPA